MKTKYIIGAIVIVVFGVWGASAFLRTTVQYVSIAEAKRSNKTVQTLGEIDFNDVHFDAENNRLIFSIFDAGSSDQTQAERMRVIYKGVVPGNFEQATQVAVRGKMTPDGFLADKLLVKCPSKYQGLENSPDMPDRRKGN
jgi:cytochrome c-type biogenesis protein CcmE